MSAVSFFILIFPYLNIFNRTILDFGSTLPFSTVLLYSNFLVFSVSAIRPSPP